LTTYQHPGVYVVEVPSTRSIQSASTSVAAFVGVTDTGPTVQPTLITSWNAYQRQFGGLVWMGFVSWAVYEFFNEGGTGCYIVRAKDTGNGKSATATVSNVTLNSATPGLWGNSLQVIISGTVSGSASSTSPLFNLLIAVDPAIFAGATLDMPTQMLKDFIAQNNLSQVVANGKSYYVLEEFDGFTPSSLACPTGATNCQLTDRLNSNSMFVRGVATPSATPTRPANSVSAFNGGTASNVDLSAATQMLTRVQGVSLLAIPDTVTAADNTGKTTQAQQATIINLNLNFCETQANNLFYVTDPPYGLSVQDMSSFKLGAGTGKGGNTQALNSSFGAIYYPWIWIYNPIANVNVPMPPSGAMLGRYASTDANVGVYKSPAGVNDGALKTVVALNNTITDSDQDFLNPVGINAVRNLINYGNVIWGARTLSMDSAWTYLCVRRMFIFVEQSLRLSLQWVVFEPNGEQLWSSVTRDVTAFLTTQWQQGALFGASAEEAFFVTCDNSNNPPESRAAGLLYIDIGLAPVYPAEFVVIRITQKTAGPDSGS
jgi:hypothetical protein